MTPPESRPATAEIRLVVVEPYEVVTKAVIEHLERIPGLHVVGQAGTIDDAGRLIEQHEPDVVIVDTRLPDGSGLDLCRRIQTLSPGTRCVIHTGTHVDESEAQEAGAAAVVLKELIGSGLVAAIKRAMGDTAARPSVER